LCEVLPENAKISDKSFFELEAKDIDDNLIKFSSLKHNNHKAFLIVNTASE